MGEVTLPRCGSRRGGTWRRTFTSGATTRVYFFEKDELEEIWGGKPSEPAEGEGQAQGLQPSFEIEELGVDRRLLVNRAKKLKMYRCWIQGRFRKK
jgi:tRNAThr (cytosine32-N3)-methyltransferase